MLLLDIIVSMKYAVIMSIINNNSVYFSIYISIASMVVPLYII